MDPDVKNVKRIPLIGYIFSGSEERPTLTLSVTGNLQSPDVENTAFKEVATYPFQVIKRTVLLPEHVAKQVDQATGDKAEENEQE